MIQEDKVLVFLGDTVMPFGTAVPQAINFPIGTWLLKGSSWWISVWSQDQRPKDVAIWQWKADYAVPKEIRMRALLL